MDVDFDERYAFDTFVEGESNRLACSAARRVSEEPGNAYNPLFIYGVTGVGKTHLLRAIGRHVRVRKPQARVVYATSERFTNEFITCIKSRRMPAFREKYRVADVLLLDDLQFLKANLEKTQEELFHLFNTLHGEKKQVVVAADVAPTALRGLDARVRTRFDWGLAVDIRPPDVEDRVRIVKLKARLEGLELPDDVANLVAASCKGTVRQLEGAVKQLGARMRLIGVNLSVALAREAVSRQAPVGTGQDLARQILKSTAKAFGAAPADITGKSRQRETVDARQVTMYLARRFAKLSLADVGRLVGGRDHTTVLHGVRQIEKRLSHDGELQATVVRLEQSLYC